MLVSALLLGSGFCSLCVAGIEDVRFRVNTFGSLSLSVSDSDTLGFIRDYHQKTPVEQGKIVWQADSSLGVQLNAHYKKFSGGVQLFARERKENDLEHLINYAYIDTRIGHDCTVRIGRNPLELYLASDNRAIGYSQLILRPVPEFYAMLFGESYPGVDVHYTRRLTTGILSLEGFAGTFDVSLLTRDTATTDYRYDPMVGFVVKFSTFDSTFLASYLWANVTDVAPVFKQLGPALSLLDSYGIPDADKFRKIVDMDDVPVHYFIAGASTQKNAWIVKGEVNHFWFKQVGDIHISTAYLLVGYVTGEWTPYGVLAGVHTRKDDLGIPVAAFAGFPQEAVSVAETLNSLYKRVYSGQLSFTLGVRWDFRQNMALKMQWGYYHVDGGGLLLWNALDEKAYDGGDVSVVSVSLDFAF